MKFRLSGGQPKWLTRLKVPVSELVFKEITRLTKKQIESLPVDISSESITELYQRAQDHSLTVDQVLGLEAWNAPGENYYLDLVVEKIKKLAEENQVLLSVFGEVIPPLARSTISDRYKKGLRKGDLVRAKDRYTNPYFAANSSINEPIEPSRQFPQKRKLKEVVKSTKRLQKQRSLVQLQREKHLLERKLMILNKKILDAPSNCLAADKEVSYFCPWGHKMIIRRILPGSPFRWDWRWTMKLAGARCEGCFLKDIHLRGEFFNCEQCRFNYCVGCAPKLGSQPSRVRQYLSVLNGTARIFLFDDGTVIAPGLYEMKYAPKKEDMIGIRYIHCTRCDNGYFGGPAFAAQKFDGTFLLWGDPKSGGTAGEKERDLVSVVQLANTQYAFAARKMDGSVITWGHPEFGGDPGKKQDILVNVTNIVSSALAFVALKADGTVVAWGAPDYGGGNAHKQHELMGVLQVVATKSAFAARKTDGTVVAWGDWIEGGDPSRQLCGHSKTSPRDKQTLLVNVKKLTSNDCAFAALKADGTVITWGCSASGGDSESVKRDLVGVLEIVATKDSFAARRQDGIVVCWGARREFDKAKLKFSHMLSAEDLDEKGVELSASLVVQNSLEDFY